MTRIRIEPAGAAMADLLSALQTASTADSGTQDAWGRDFIGRLLAMPGAFALWAGFENDARPCGYGLFRAASTECEVLSIGVLPTARRRGVGRALMTAAVSQAKLAGAKAIFLEVAVDNASARALYLALGFREVGRRPGYYQRRPASSEAAPIAPVDALVLRKDIGP